MPIRSWVEADGVQNRTADGGPAGNFIRRFTDGSGSVTVINATSTLPALAGHTKTIKCTCPANSRAQLLLKMWNNIEFDNNWRNVSGHNVEPRWVGYAVMLPPDWAVVSDFFNLGEIHHTKSAGGAGIPPWLIGINSSNIRSAQGENEGNNTAYSKQISTIDPYLGKYAIFVVKYLARASGGRAQVWLGNETAFVNNGNTVYDWPANDAGDTTNGQTWYGINDDLDHQFGLYKPGAGTTHSIYVGGITQAYETSTDRYTAAAIYTELVGHAPGTTTLPPPATIKYTDNDTDPKLVGNANTKTYSVPFAISTSKIITAYTTTGSGSTLQTSPNARFEYILVATPAAPVANPPSTNFASSFTATLSSPPFDPAVSIFYTTGETAALTPTPTIASTLYTTGGISVPAGTAKVIKAFAWRQTDSGTQLSSAVTTITYTPTVAAPNPPTVDIAPGAKTGPLTITLTPPLDSFIRYTRNAEDPLTSAQAVETTVTGGTLRLRISATTRIRARSRNGNGFSATEFDGTYTLPAVSNPPGASAATFYDDFLEGTEVFLGSHAMVKSVGGVTWINSGLNGSTTQMRLLAGVSYVQADAANASYHVNLGATNTWAEVSYSPRNLAANVGALDLGFDPTAKSRYSVRFQPATNAVTVERFFGEQLERTFTTFKPSPAMTLAETHRVRIERTVPDSTSVRLRVVWDTQEIFAGLDTDANRVTLGTYARITHYTYAAPGGAFTSFMASNLTVATSGTPDLLVRRGDVTAIPAASPYSSTATFTAVPTLSKALIVSSTTTAAGGGPSTNQTVGREMPEVTSHVTLTNTTTATAAHVHNAVGETLAQFHPFELLYFAGTPGDPNDFNVLARTTITLAELSLTASVNITSPSVSSRVALFWTNAGSTSTFRFDRVSCTCQLISTTSGGVTTFSIKATRGDATNGVVEVKVFAVEFTGTNWGVTPLPVRDVTALSTSWTGLTPFDVAHSFVYTGQRMRETASNTQPHFIDVASHVAKVVDETSVSTTFAPSATTRAPDVTVIGWVVSNPQMNVRQAASTLITLPTTLSRTAKTTVTLSPPVADMNATLTIPHAYIDLTGGVTADNNAHPQAHVSSKLTDTQTILVERPYTGGRGGRLRVQVIEFQAVLVATPLFDAGQFLEMFNGGTYSVTGSNFQDQGADSRLYLSPTATFSLATAVSQIVSFWSNETITFSLNKGTVGGTTAYLFAQNQAGLISDALQVTINVLPPSAGNVRGFEALQVTLTVDNLIERIENLNPSTLINPATNAPFPVAGGYFKVWPRQQPFTKIDSVIVLSRGTGTSGNPTPGFTASTPVKDPQLGIDVYIYINGVAANLSTTRVDIVIEGT